MDTQEQKPKEVFWYKIQIERVDEKGYDAKTRFELHMRFEPKDMYRLVKEIVDFSVSDE